MEDPEKPTLSDERRLFHVFEDLSDVDHPQADPDQGGLAVPPRLQEALPLLRSAVVHHTLHRGDTCTTCQMTFNSWELNPFEHINY